MNDNHCKSGDPDTETKSAELQCYKERQNVACIPSNFCRHCNFWVWLIEHVAQNVASFSV